MVKLTSNDLQYNKAICYNAVYRGILTTGATNRHPGGEKRLPITLDQEAGPIKLSGVRRDYSAAAGQIIA
jgi:hypothetical protein